MKNKDFVAVPSLKKRKHEVPTKKVREKNLMGTDAARG